MGKNEQQKARVRERYKGINRDELEVIPAIKIANIFDDTAEKRVAVYARVSTDDLNQTSSYELQKNYYQDMVNRNPQWKLVDIYADEGISGTSLNHRNAFVQMIEDCENGKIDLIITKDDFIATQRLITNSKYGYKGLLPSLHVIDSGALCGFVEINPRWSGFSREDYLDAVQSLDDINALPSVSFREKEVQAGEFDLRGYEIVRSQFFRSCHDITVTFSLSELLFSKQCVVKLHNTATVELLFDPIHHRLAVRPTDKDNRHGVVWAKVYQHKSICKPIRGSAFLPTIFEILGWKPDNKYRIRGVRRQKGQEVVLLFDLCETVISLPIHSASESEDSVDMSAVLSAQGIQPLASSSAKRLTAFPEEWAYSFGRDVYCHEQSPELAAIDRDGQWDVLHKGAPYIKGKDVNPSSTDDLQIGIESILTTINQETTLNG